MSHVQLELTQESEAVKVTVVNDRWIEDDPAYAQNADGWPRILSRLKTLLETGKHFVHIEGFRFSNPIWGYVRVGHIYVSPSQEKSTEFLGAHRRARS